MSKRVVEKTVDGWTMLVRAQVIYQNADGQFVSREDYVRNREGYGGGGYGRARHAASGRPRRTAPADQSSSWLAIVFRRISLVPS